MDGINNSSSPLSQVRAPTFEDILRNRVMVEATGLACGRIFLRKVSLYIPVASVEIVTHCHLDQMAAFSKVVFAPAEVVSKLQTIYRQFNLKKQIIPWSNYRRTFHFFRGDKVFSSVMEFAFPVLGESGEQRKLFHEHYRNFRNGVVVRTPETDTKETPLTAGELPEGWLFADNRKRKPEPRTMFKVSTTLYEMSVDERIWSAVHEYLHSKPSLKDMSLEVRI